MAKAEADRAPTVSITSAFYNTGPPILDMIRSILAQTYPDWELVLLDDGSTDNSLELARSIDDPRIRIFSNDRNLGRGTSLNRLTSLARGSLIARMDSDDFCAPERIEKQVDYLTQHAEVDVVGTGILFVDTQCRPLGVRGVPLAHDVICRHPSRMIDICHGSILARRGWLERFSYDESIPIAVDSNLFFRAYQESTFGNIDEPMYYYRYEPSFTLVKQWASRRELASYIFTTHRKAGHLGKALIHWAIQYAKFGFTAACFATGQRRRLMAKRFESLSQEQRHKYEQDWRLITSQAIQPEVSH